MTSLAAPLRKGFGRLATVALLGVLVAGVVAWQVGGGGGYHVTIIFPEATDLQKGSLVEVQGFQVGKVSGLGVNDGQAMVTVSLSGPNAPLHAGSKAKIDYKALLGERYVEITPGPSKNPAIPDGGVLPGGEDRVELAQVLSALTPQTRQRLADDMPQLAATLADPSNANHTLQSAAPTVQALAQVLDAVGQNGLALRQLVSSMSDLSTRLVNRQGALVSTVSGLTKANTAIAAQDSSLTTGLQNLPSTLNEASAVLGHVPATTAQVVPLLDDLAPGAAALPSFASKLRPVLDQLSPVTAELQPNLTALNALLGRTPALVGTANATVPGVTQATSTLTSPQKVTVPTDSNGTATTQVTTTVEDWARAYTPELAGFLTNWGNWLSAYTSDGHIGPFQAVVGTGALTGEIPTSNNYASPATSFAGLPLPATATNGPPFPGTIAGQPCTSCYDAAGNPIQ